MSTVPKCGRAKGGPLVSARADDGSETRIELDGSDYEFAGVLVYGAWGVVGGEEGD